MRDPGRRWAWILLVAAAVFIACATTIILTGVPFAERAVYDTVTAAVPNGRAFRSLTRLGAIDTLLPLGVILAVLLPRSFLRRWWMWIVVMVAVGLLETLGKAGIGRPRPHGLRPGFPSGHTAAAAAFYLMACYFFEAVVRRWMRYVLYGVGALIVALVGLSRMALRVHWPLDVLGGAALGVAIFAAAAWWHERSPLEDVVRAAVPARWRVWLYRWQNVLPLALLPLPFLAPPFALTSTLLAVALHVAGGLSMATALALRLWAAAHRERRFGVPARPPTRLVTSGPYAYMRHPLPLANLLTGVGAALIAENGLAMLLVPTALIAMYRITTPLEDAWLAERFGHAYVDYCARVPALPRLALPSLAAVWSAIGALGPNGVLAQTSWRALVWRLPAVAATLALAAFAELSERGPHLFR